MQGMVISLFDFAKGGLIPPHVHPRASEIAFVIKGGLLVGFVDTSNKLFTQILEIGDEILEYWSAILCLLNFFKCLWLLVTIRMYSFLIRLGA
jgi:hypothetical protein